MISVVAVFLPDATSISTRVLVQRDQYLLALIQTVSEFTDALDGQFVSMPYGGFLAWFGQPYSHLDDADRALHLAQSIQKWSDHYCLNHFGEHESELLLDPIGIGVATHPEVVAEQTVHLTGAESFRSAAFLMRHARLLGRPLADESTQRLAPLSVPWLRDMTTSKEFIGSQRERSNSAIGEYSQRSCSAIGFPHHQTQSCLYELTASGLIAPKSGGGFQFRGLMTAQAIHNLTVAVSKLGES